MTFTEAVLAMDRGVVVKRSPNSYEKGWIDQVQYRKTPSQSYQMRYRCGFQQGKAGDSRGVWTEWLPIEFTKEEVEAPSWHYCDLQDDAPLKPLGASFSPQNLSFIQALMMVSEGYVVEREDCEDRVVIQWFQQPRSHIYLSRYKWSGCGEDLESRWSQWAPVAGFSCADVSFVGYRIVGRIDQEGVVVEKEG